MTQWEKDQIRKSLRGDQSSVVEVLRKELAASQEQVRVLREALNFTVATIRRMGFEDDGPACSSVDILKVCKQALSTTPEPRMLSELKAARDALSDFTDGLMDSGYYAHHAQKALTRLDAFLKEFE